MKAVQVLTPQRAKSKLSLGPDFLHKNKNEIEKQAGRKLSSFATAVL